ncbi:4Fe-4S binding protein [candidate division KSB1 bacterium]|jgi:ferredoxin|nr:4Fe-4S binding protein [candidate division KSB1 bacterium]
MVIRVKKDQCDFCGTCVAVCPADAIELYEARLEVDAAKCSACENCIKICPIAALEWSKDETV